MGVFRIVGVVYLKLFDRIVVSGTAVQAKTK